MIQPLAPEVRSLLRSGIATPTVAQCVEELVLNSIDAGATCVAIRVDIANYKIQVIDNGCGLNKDEMNIIGERYATSKCHDVKDLDNLSFFGYRGEALASISHISGVLEIVSKKKESDVTYSKLFRNGKPLDVFESSKQRPSPGTTVTVHSVFQNLPVRKKMLSPSLDYERIRKRIQGLALIHPKVSITLRDDGTGSVSIQTHCTSSIINTFVRLFGQDYSQILKKVQCSNHTFTVDGFIGMEGHFNKKLQFVYVNKRLVTKTKLHKLANILLGRSLIAKRKVESDGRDGQQNKDGAYSDLASPGRSHDLYGIFVLNIDCSLSEYDITLDPGKTLVEFKDWSSVLRCLEELITDFLKKENLTMKLDKPSTSSAIEEVSGSQIVDEESQEDDIECTSLSEVAKDRIADLSDKYGRGIHTSNCSNTLTGLIVRRGAVQNSSSGDSADIQIYSEGSDSTCTHEGSPEFPKNANTVVQAHLGDRAGIALQETAVDSSETSLEITGRNVTNLLSVNNSAGKISSATAEVVNASDSEESSLKESMVIPETLSEGSKSVLLFSDSSVSEGSIQTKGAVAKDPIEHSSVLIEPQGPPGCVNTPIDSISHVNVIEISSETNSECSSSGSAITGLESNNDDQDSATPQKIQLFSASPETTQSYTTPDLQSVSRTVEKNSSEKSAGRESPTDDRLAELRAGNSSENVSEFISDIYKTPVGYHPPAPTRNIGLTRAVSSLGAFRYKKAPGNSLKTATGTEEAIREQDSSSDKPNCTYQSSLYRFKQSIKPRNTLGVKNVQTSECKTSSSSIPKASSPSSAALQSKERNKPHLENTVLKDDSACSVSSMISSQSRVSSTALLSKERSIPQLGNTVLKEDAACLSRSIITANQSNQNKYEGKNNQTSCSAQACERKEHDIGRVQCLLAVACNLVSNDDNNKNRTLAGYTKQNESDFDRHWEDINVSRSDSNNQRMDLYSRCTQKKPNLKRLRSQFDIHMENTPQVNSVDRIERNKQDIHPEKRFLTSESFLVSAQDLLGLKPQISDRERCLSSTNMESLRSRDRKSSMGDGIWSAIEEDCRDIYKTRDTTSSAISLDGIPYSCAEKTSHLQDSIRTSVGTIDREIYVSDPARCNLGNGKICHNKFEEGGDKHEHDRKSISLDKPLLIRGDRKSTQIYSETNESDNQTIVVSDLVSRTEASYNDGGMDDSFTKRASRNMSESDNSREQVNVFGSSSLSQIVPAQENTVKYVQDQACVSTSELLGASSSTGDVNSSSNYFSDQVTQNIPPSSTNIVFESSSSYREHDLKMYQVDAEENRATEAILQSNYSTDRTPPFQDTQRFSPSCRDIMVEPSTSNSKLELRLGELDKDNEAIQEARQQTNYSTESTTPVLDTQSFSPSSRDILIEGSSSACESDINVERNSTGEIDTDQKSDVDQRVDLARQQTEKDNVKPRSESDDTRSKVEDDTTKSSEPENNRCQNESDKCEVSKGLDPVVTDANCTILHSTTERAKNIEVAIDTEPIIIVDPASIIIVDTDPKGACSDQDAGVIEDRDLVRIGGEPEWISQYDPKKGHTVYINVQSGNCTFEKPNLSEMHADGEKRKDFRDGASASSSVNACMTNAGKSHPLLSHNATPFLPRNKKQRLGVNIGQSVTGEKSASTSVAIDNLVEKHLEKEDQDIACKWRDDDKENNVQGPGKEDDGDGLMNLLSSLSNPASYGSSESNILDIRSNQTSASAVRIHGTLHPYKFTKDMFQDIKVIGQVDNKFIACMVNTEADIESSSDPNLLILIDQHAAHERVRLEQLTADAYEKDPSSSDSDNSEDNQDSPAAIKSSSVLPPVQLTLSAEEVRLIKVFKPKLQRLGVGIRTTNEESTGGCRVVKVTHLPACMVEREAHELRRGRQSVALAMAESLIKEQLDLLQDTSGASAVLPKTITKLLNSQACHGAIKFGDKLAKDECLTLIGQLSQCDLPFQCAHGRPSLIPVLDIKLLKSKLTANETDVDTPQLWKLKKRLQRKADDKP